jgi:hypothetical protein
MASRRSRPRRLLLPTVLAAVLAAEITGMALARTLAPAAPVAPVAAPVAAASAPPASRPSSTVRPDATDPSRWPVPTITTPGPLVTAPATAHPTVSSGTARAVTERISTKFSSRGGGSTGSRTSSPSFHSQNHVWIPSLGINANVQSFPCSRSRPPDAGVYRWGCAGTNNVYLLGHAWSTFKPLHDAYVGGRLHTGLRVSYADGAGTVHTYSVAWWKVVAPTTAASWAWAPLSRPSMTLQTCVGANSQYRLMVRLVQIG